MNKKYLHRVIDQLVSETRIDYNTQEGDDEGRIYTPISSTPLLLPFSFSSPFFSSSSSFFFSKHCKEVYGLNDDEVKYVWEEYREIIKDKIENNGL